MYSARSFLIFLVAFLLSSTIYWHSCDSVQQWGTLARVITLNYTTVSSGALICLARRHSKSADIMAPRYFTVCITAHDENMKSRQDEDEKEEGPPVLQEAPWTGTYKSMWASWPASRRAMCRVWLFPPSVQKLTKHLATLYPKCHSLDINFMLIELLY